MIIRLVLHAIFDLSILVSLVMSNSAWSLNDELSAPETDFSLNDEVLAFDQPILSPQDGSDLFFEGVENSGLISSDDDGVGEPFELADCPSSELFPALDKSRMRRRDGSSECKNPASTPPSGSNPPFDAARNPFGSQGMMQLLNSVRTDRQKNDACGYLTRGLLPFGLCHSGVGTSSTDVAVTIGELKFQTVNLQHCSPGMFKPKPSLT